MVGMIITDLDNTLLHSDKKISDYTCDMLERCREKGIKIVFATARSAQACSRFVEQFMPDIFIGYGGGLVTAGDTVIRRFDIPADISNRLIRECLNTPEISSIHAVNESVALTNDREYGSREGETHYKYDRFKDDYDYAYLKISVVSGEPSAVENIASHFLMCDMLRYSGEDLYRFANREAVKWNAVKAVSEYYGIGTDKFIAFGDDLNDLEMLRKCGTGVAVKNAVAEVKAVVGYICDTNDNDGVAKWIEENIL